MTDNRTTELREKLKADVREYYRIGLPGIQETELNRLYYEQVTEWLDRMEKIVERECINTRVNFAERIRLYQRGYYDGMRAIDADEAATLGNGTCEIVLGEDDYGCDAMVCSKCFKKIDDACSPNYCPNCGAKVVKR